VTQVTSWERPAAAPTGNIFGLGIAPASAPAPVDPAAFKKAADARIKAAEKAAKVTGV
jgi:hypothetical protein